jgi:hypothetical protein
LHQNSQHRTPNFFPAIKPPPQQACIQFARDVARQAKDEPPVEGIDLVRRINRAASAVPAAPSSGEWLLAALAANARSFEAGGINHLGVEYGKVTFHGVVIYCVAPPRDNLLKPL